MKAQIKSILLLIFLLSTMVPKANEGRVFSKSAFDIGEPVVNAQTFSIAENLNNGATVGTVIATDPNALALTYSIAEGNTGNTFEIVASGAEAGKLTVADSTLLDFETTTTFALKVNVSNGSGVTQGEITVNLTNVNETPKLDNFTVEMFDNIADNAAVVTAVATDVDAGTTFTYSIIDGNADNVFAIDAATGAVTINDNTAIDVVGVPQYSLTIQVSDGALIDEGLLTVNVLKFNNPPVINTQTFSLDENVANATVVGTVAAGDADGDNFTFSITSGNDAGAFAIDGASGEITVLDNTKIDFEVTPVFSLGVEVRETATSPVKFASAVITINLQNLNETPLFASQTFEIFETAQNTDLVGDIVATDQDTGTTLAYTIQSGNGAGVFALDGTTGKLTILDNTSLDAAVTPSYVLGVRVSDGTFDVDANINVNVFEFNTAPTIEDITFAIDENSAIATAIGTMDFSDAEADGLTFSIVSGNDLGAFAIDANTSELSVADNAPLDFETNPTFSLRVVVAQTAPVLTDTATVTINLNNVPEAPSIVDQQFIVAENSPNGFVLGTVAATNPDGDALNFSVTDGDPDGIFFIRPSGEIAVIDSANLNFESQSQFVLTVRVEKANNSALSNSATVTIDVTDLNDTPIATGATFEIFENITNNTVIGTIVATDEDGHNLTFSITDGNGDGVYTIDATTGIITVADSTLIDFEINPQFTLTVLATETTTDPALSDTAVVVINVKNVNEAPTIEDQTYSIADNLEIGDLVAKVIANDPDAGTTLAFTILSGNTGNVFQIGTSSGDLIIRDNFPLDAVTTPQYLLEVQVSDGSFTRKAIITINVTKFNEAPVVNNQVVNLDENPAANAVVYQVVATDDGDDYTFSITGGNGSNAFAISATGLITVADATQIDFETTPRYDLKVTVTETNSVELFSTTANVRVNIINKNESPVIAAQSFSIPEQSVVGFAVGRVAATDPDNLDFPTFTIKSGNTGTTFAINSINGQLTVANNTVLRFATNPVFTLNIEVDDGEFKTNADVTINLIKINAPPVIADQNVIVNENTVVGVAIDTLVASDIDSDELKFILQSGNRGGTFSLDANGTLRVANNTLLDFETDSTFTLTIVVQEALLNPAKTDTATVKVTIVNVNEAPVMADSVFTIAERSPNNTVVGTMKATDQDVGAVIRYSITAGNTGNAFAINQTTGQIRVAATAALVFATTPVFTLTIRATDGTLNKDAKATINLIELNLAPVVTSKTITIAENTPKDAFVDSVKAVDPNMDAIAYEITAGNIGNAFAISSAGVITVTATDSLVYTLHPEFKLTVTATDNKTPALSGTGVITIKLNDVPVFGNQSFSVVENSEKDLEIGQLEASDQVGGALKFTIISGNPQQAVAVSDSGRITINNPDVFDFETFRSFTLVVQATDSTLTKNAIVTIFIVDDPEGPIISDQEYSIVENPVPGALLGRVKAVDPDGRELVYTIISGNIDGAFFLNSAGTLTVANPGPINFEINPVISLIVQVNDEADSAQATVRINVLDKNDAPEFKSQIIAIAEDTPAGTVIGNIDASDPEGDAITYTMISGNLDSAFAVSATGELTVLRAVLDYEKKKLYTLTIEVKDDTLAFQNIIEIEITNVVDNILLTGIDDEELKITVFPNPVADRLFVNIPPTISVERIIMIDLSGRTHFTAGEVWGDQLEINMTTYKPGMYILMINDQSFKIIKK